MDFNGFTLPDITPRIDTSFIDEMNTTGHSAMTVVQ